jgi:hypothetical protein
MFNQLIPLPAKALVHRNETLIHILDKKELLINQNFLFCGTKLPPQSEKCREWFQLDESKFLYKTLEDGKNPEKPTKLVLE